MEQRQLFHLTHVVAEHSDEGRVSGDWVLATEWGIMAGEIGWAWWACRVAGPGGITTDCLGLITPCCISTLPPSCLGCLAGGRGGTAGRHDVQCSAVGLHTARFVSNVVGHGQGWTAQLLTKAGALTGPVSSNTSTGRAGEEGRKEGRKEGGLGERDHLLRDVEGRSTQP